MCVPALPCLIAVGHEHQQIRLATQYRLHYRSDACIGLTWKKKQPGLGIVRVVQEYCVNGLMQLDIFLNADMLRKTVSTRLICHGSIWMSPQSFRVYNYNSIVSWLETPFRGECEL